MHDEAQMVRRVKAYLAQRQIIKNEEELKKLSQKCEPDPERKQTMTNQPSTTSVASTVSTDSVYRVVLTFNNSNVDKINIFRTLMV